MNTQLLQLVDGIYAEIQLNKIAEQYGNDNLQVYSK